MPSSLYVPVLIAGMLLTVRPLPLCLPPFVLTPNRAPATRYGASGRSVSPRLTRARAPIPDRLNSIPSCLQDMQCVENCDDPNPAHHVLYEQPVWQTLQMFRASPFVSWPAPPVPNACHRPS